MSSVPRIAILGGGPAGLAVAWAARRRGLSCTLLEAAAVTGGNCRTLHWNGFRYDSGAHRLHDRDPEITREVQALLGADLRRIDVPSQIWDDGRLVRFPLAPAQLLAHLGPGPFSRAVLQVLAARLQGGDSGSSFAGFAERRYGRIIADRFLLNYSEKLWGAPAASLSPAIAGKRLNGLDLRTFIAESLLHRQSSNHVEGVFFYPRLGIGMITDRMAEACGPGVIRTSTPVARLRHDGELIRAVEGAGGEVVEAEVVVSSLPLGRTLAMLEPAPPSEVLELARRIRYRQVRIAVLFVDRAGVTEAATVYFPDRRFPFTRISEPRNRSPEMSPPGKTSLMAEIPCHQDDSIWRADDAAVLDTVRDRLVEIGWLEPRDVLGGAVHRLVNAYPVLDLDSGEAVEGIHDYLATFTNLRLVGRSGRFVYGWIHDMMRAGLEVVEEIIAEAGGG